MYLAGDGQVGFCTFMLGLKGLGLQGSCAVLHGGGLTPSRWEGGFPATPLQRGGRRGSTPHRPGQVVTVTAALGSLGPMRCLLTAFQDEALAPLLKCRLMVLRTPPSEQQFIRTDAYGEDCELAGSAAVHPFIARCGPLAAPSGVAPG